MQGATSRGVFLRLSSGWLFFLSTERYRGPLTLNLQEGAEILPSLETGMAVEIEAGRIRISGAGRHLYFDQAETWQSPSLPEAALTREECMDQLALTVRELKRLNKHSYFSDILPGLASISGSGMAYPDALPLNWVSLRNALTEGKLEASLRAADNLFGLGGGLTPSGDDFLTGLILALNRWEHVLAAGMDLETLNRELTSLAYKKTTRLSANLVECACQGQADERLLLALDGILAGNYAPAQCALALAGWGNTSGVDALAGMALGVSLR